MKFLSPIDLNKNELRNAVIQNLASAPSTPVLGQIYFDTTTNTNREWNGTAWIAFDASKVANGYIPMAKLATDPLARANHTGTQLAATISDFNTAVRTNRLDQMAAPTADVALGSQKITGLAAGVVGTDAVNVTQLNTAVDNAAAGIDSKPSVRVVATSNITLSGLQTIDSVSLSAGNRALLTAQTTASQNGPYIVASGAWTRVVDADATGEITPGAFWFVEEGTVNGATQWRCSNTGAVTLGSTSITIAQYGGGSSYTAGDGLTLTGSEFNVVAGAGILAGADVAIDTAVVARKYSVAVGDNSATTITVTHNLGTVDVTFSLRDASGNRCEVDWTAATTNTVVLTFAVAPTTNQYRATVIA